MTIAVKRRDQPKLSLIEIRLFDSALQVFKCWYDKFWMKSVGVIEWIGEKDQGPRESLDFAPTESSAQTCDLDGAPGWGLAFKPIDVQRNSFDYVRAIEVRPSDRQSVFRAGLAARSGREQRLGAETKGGQPAKAFIPNRNASASGRPSDRLWGAPEYEPSRSDGRLVHAYSVVDDPERAAQFFGGFELDPTACRIGVVRIPYQLEDSLVDVCHELLAQSLEDLGRELNVFSHR
jgi:hypothetical protein